MALAAVLKRKVRQTDIPGAFLLGPPQKTLYMRAPSDQIEYDPIDGTPYVYKVIGNVYGTKSSNKVFQDTLTDWLLETGFERQKHDPCLYIKDKGGDKEIQLVGWVDDLSYHSPSDSAIKEFELQLQSKWGNHKEMEFEDMKYFLGMNVEQTAGQIHIHHEVMIKQLIEKYFPNRNPGHQNAVHTKSTPFPPGATCNKSDCPKLGDERLNAPYRELVGALSYLSVVSRPDISYNVSQLASVQANPGETHWKLAKHVLRYLAKNAAPWSHLQKWLRR